MSDELKIDRRGSVALLTLNRPQVLNALNQPLVDAIIERLREIEGKDEFGAVVIDGSGRAFCSGHDLKELLKATPLERRAIFTKSIQVYEEIAKMGKPVIAAVHGIATAAGCGLAAACDLVIASEDAIFQTPGVNIGIFCLTPMIPLQRSIGRKKAMEMLLTGDPVDAREAERLGLVNRVVPTGKHVEEAVELGQKISSKCRIAYEIGKPAFYMMDDTDYVKALHYAKDLITLVTLTEDAEEGLTAILEKRNPTWKHR
ncbi:MAG: enoyl-CoA hydratase-related protein [Candidatus Bathyarchaeia archaeon]